MAMGIVLTFVIALIVSVPILRTTEMMPFSIVTIAFGLTVYMVISGSSFLGSTLGITGIPPFSLGPFELDDAVEMYYFCWVVTFLLIFFCLYMVNSQWGLAVRAIFSDIETAEVVGINVQKYRLEVFLLSATLSGLAGSLFAFHLRGMDPTNFSFWRMLLFLLGLLFGGERSIWGAMVGSIIIFLIIPEAIGVLSNYISWISRAIDLIYGIIFTLILYFLPQGLMGLLRRRKVKSIKRSPDPSTTPNRPA
jgi:branched-chain amino acid transport system permease protein